MVRIIALLKSAFKAISVGRVPGRQAGQCHFWRSAVPWHEGLSLSICGVALLPLRLAETFSKRRGFSSLSCGALLRKNKALAREGIAHICHFESSNLSYLLNSSFFRSSNCRSVSSPCPYDRISLWLSSINWLRWQK